MTLVSFTGNITSDLRFGESTGRDGNTRRYVAFNVAVNGMPDAQGERGVIFYSCISSNKAIVEGLENVATPTGSLKGFGVVVSGTMNPKQYTSKEGVSGMDYSVNVTDVGISPLFQKIKVAKEPKNDAQATPATPQATPQATPANAQAAVDEFFGDL